MASVPPLARGAPQPRYSLALVLVYSGSPSPVDHLVAGTRIFGADHVPLGGSIGWIHGVEESVEKEKYAHSSDEC